jgi:hypothetical protein
LRAGWFEIIYIFFRGYAISGRRRRFSVNDLFMEAKKFIDGSAATHFIEVWKGIDDTESHSSMFNTINVLENYIRSTSSKGKLETVAVWRIKPTDEPIQFRLRRRGISRKAIHSMWMQKVEYLKNQAKQNANTEL